MEIEITEFCPHCEKENTFRWDIKANGWVAHCLHCGTKLILCSECEDQNCCDWNRKTNCCHKCLTSK